MDRRYLLLGATHFLCTALVLKLLYFILPCSITCYYSCAAYFVMCTIVARLTFCCTKRRFLNDRISSCNKAVFITGCDSGFGNALAKRLDSKGFHVFASCLNKEGPGADDLRKSCSKRLLIPQVDVTSDDSVKQALEFVKENLGTSELWAIVNNAGIQSGFSTELTSMKEFKETMEVNAFGMVRVTKAFLPLLRQSKGRVVNVASLAGRLALPHCSPYTMSKFAAVGFSECLRQELDVWGVKVISIEPEFFQTGMTDVANATKRMDNTFDAIEEDIRADYGENYLNAFKSMTHFGGASPKLEIPLNAIEKAISLEHPALSYHPRRNAVMALIICGFQCLPKMLQHFIIGSIASLCGFPKPKEADNL